MTNDLAAAMRRAAGLTRAFDVVAASRTIQEALARHALPSARDEKLFHQAPSPEQRTVPPLLADTARGPEPSAKRVAAASVDGTPAKRLVRGRRPLGEVLRTLRTLREGRSFDDVGGLSLRAKPRSPPRVLVDGAQFVSRSFTCPSGTRGYKLYIPACARNRPRGLVMMLHGCQQDPDDFAAGTGMNSVAEAHGLMVAYPSQPASANAASCWNWFNPSDQVRDRGEPAIIAGITRTLISEFDINAGCVYVAGLSAGGAMAAVMGEAYPDLYDAIGIHSGLAYGAANDVMSAFSAMAGGSAMGGRALINPGTAGAKTKTGDRTQPKLPMIVFQGSSDRTVHPSNADRIVAQATRGRSVGAQHDRVVMNGRTHTRTTIRETEGATILESWRIEGGGHAWSGGDPSGSFTDATGPDASTEMVRFFLGCRLH
jgi:poly(hydroxyalkanoate) depolymerase family esterase